MTFLPKFLFKYFTRVAYIYFLVQACLCYWTAVSPFAPWGSTMALVFVVVVAAIKEIIEDRKRQQEDKATNGRITYRMRADGGFEPVEWAGVLVGDFVLVKDGELFPADLLCVHCALPDKLCFIKTANLDGETNLKIRKPVEWPDAAAAAAAEAPQDDGQGGSSPPVMSPRSAPERMPRAWVQEFQRFGRTLHCEGPSPDLRNFRGYLRCAEGGGGPGVMPLSMEEMLLRGCNLKNSGFIIGLVVYTGRESRIQMNTRPVPFKMGSLDGFLNYQIAIFMVVQLVICAALAVLAWFWRENAGLRRFWLALDVYSLTNSATPALFIFIQFITNWILFSYLIPISLFVSMEMVKFWMTFIYINYDGYMRDPETGEFARARNSNVIEDLGRVEYVFSDKTGTLTANEMRLRLVGIGGVAFGSADAPLEKAPVPLGGREALQYFDARLFRAAESFLADWRGGEAGAGAGAGGVNPYYFTAALRNKVAWDHFYDGVPGHLTVPEEQALDLNDLRLGKMAFDYWLNICVCHSLVIDAETTARRGHPTYQGPSPDEVALVDCARMLGFALVNRTSSHLELDFFGTTMSFCILNILEFDSDRKRMSVIAEAPNGRIVLFSKGADSVMLKLLKDHAALPGGTALLEATDRNLHYFASKGLRTLILASKEIDRKAWERWDYGYQLAVNTLGEKREARIAEASAEIEAGLDLVGVAAIEDKLQDGVPEAVFTLLQAGIRVWVLTGDKQETAISIGISCNLIKAPEKLMICNANSHAEAQAALEAVERQLRTQIYEGRGGQMSSPGGSRSPSGRARPPGLPRRRSFTEVPSTVIQTPGRDMVPCELVVDGHTLGLIMDTELEVKLAELAVQCTSVLICRASPSQKAQVVKMVRKHRLRTSALSDNPVLKHFQKVFSWSDDRILAIGDGANDVALLQSADVGVGIAGKEGKQAVNNSDFAIGQFRFLIRLMLVHGQLSYYRLGGLIKYSFYKNVTFAMSFFFFQFFNGFSGTALVDSITAAFFNIVLTSLPIIVFAAMDQPVSMKTLSKYPQTYNTSRTLTSLNFWRTSFFRSTFTAAVIFFVPFFTISPVGRYNIDGVSVAGKTTFIALLGSVTAEMAILARSWNWLFAFCIVASYFTIYLIFLVLPAIERALAIPDVELWNVGQTLFRSPLFWFQILLCNCITIGVRVFEKAWKTCFNPEDFDILAEREKLAKLKRKKAQQGAQAKGRASHKGEPDRREAPVAAAEGALASIPEAETQVELTVQAPTTTFHTPGRVTVH